MSSYRVLFWVMGLLGVMSLGGCGASQIKPVGEAGEPFLDSDAVISPLAMDSRLRLMDENEMIGVGQAVSTVFEGSYQKPAKSTSVTELPTGFEGNFRSSGWQTYRRTFAVLSKDDRVILALDHRERAKEEDVQEAVGKYVRQYGSPLGMVESGTSKYRFWQDGSVRLMLVEFKGEEIGFTSAVGLTKVMDELGMSLATAEVDAAAADSLMKLFETE